MKDDATRLALDAADIFRCKDDPTTDEFRQIAETVIAAVVAREVAATRAELSRARQDVIDAAAELMVEFPPPPGSDMAKVMIANAIMRRERDAARTEIARVRAVADDTYQHAVQRWAETQIERDAALARVAELARESGKCETCAGTGASKGLHMRCPDCRGSGSEIDALKQLLERAEAQVKLLRASLVKLRDRVDSISADVDQALTDAESERDSG